MDIYVYLYYVYKKKIEKQRKEITMLNGKKLIYPTFSRCITILLIVCFLTTHFNHLEPSLLTKLTDERVEPNCLFLHSLIRKVICFSSSSIRKSMFFFAIHTWISLCLWIEIINKTKWSFAHKKKMNMYHLSPFFFVEYTSEKENEINTCETF